MQIQKTNLNEILDFGSNVQKNKNGSKFSKQELMNKYFNPFLDKKSGKTQEIYNIRIVPNLDGTNPFNLIKFHNVKMPNNKTEKFLCLSETSVNGEKVQCPLCQTYWDLKNNGQEEEAKNFKVHEFYIVRVIVRGKEHEGVKFWRFRRNYKGDGFFDKITSLINGGANPIDAEDGYDIVITCKLDERKNTTYQLMPNVGKGKCKLMDNETEMFNFINDETKWQDIFKPKTEEHLIDVTQGKALYWSDEMKKYVRPGEEHLQSGNESAMANHIMSNNETDAFNTPTETVQEQVNITSVVATTEAEDDDLPF